MPLTIFFSSPGVYTIDDDGIRGNNTSVVRDASGTVLFPFTHPGDTIDFIAEVPGITFVFNTADSFGTANVTVGSLSDPALSPDSIVVRQMRTDAFMTLVSNGTIVEGGADAAADLIAAGLTMSAGTGIGGSGNALETQITFIEAETNTGGITIANSGSVQVGGLTPDVAGLNVVTSGNINFSSVGFILLADGTGASTVHGGDTLGNVTLTAIGPDSDIFSNIDQRAISAAGGGITLTAGRDVIFGTSGTNFNNDLLATGPIHITAGRDFQLDGTSDVRTGAFGGVFGGEIDIRAGRNINLSSLTGGLQTVQAFAGNVLLTTGPGGVFFENAAFPGAIQTTNDIVLVTDNAQINSGGLNTTGVGSVTIRPVTPGKAIDLGTVLDGPASLGLSDDEFDLLFTLNVNVGDANTGPVTFSAPLSPFIVDNLTVHSGTEIQFNSTLALPRTLTLRAGDDVVFASTASFSSTNEGLTVFVDNAQDDDGTGGYGNLGGTISVNTSIQLFGNLDRDTLSGSAANDILDGLAGADTLVGLAGDDWFIVDNAGDVVVEATGEGANDRVFASLSYTLAGGTYVETLSTADSGGTAAINLTGNELTNALIGNAGNNSLNGAAGADTLGGLGGDDWYFIDNAADVVNEATGAGADRVFAAVSYVLGAARHVETMSTTNNAGTGAINLTGNELVNALIGNAGNNSLNGGIGADTLSGLAGDDFYFVDNAADVVNETVGNGADRVFASVSYTLGAGRHVEIMSTTDSAGVGAINLTGNELVNSIVGNAGNNTLNGGVGADTLNGQGGDDWYIVDNAADVAIELVGNGNDRVFTSVSFTLGAGRHIETMSTTDSAGTGALILTGNELVNALIGNAGNNTLNGGVGADTLSGLGGDDFYYVDDAADVVNETVGNGNDRVFASVSYTLGAGRHVETLSTTDNAGTAAINLTGNELADSIVGNAGTNVLDGKGGADILNGFGNADIFQFSTALGGGNIDQVQGFDPANDLIRLENAVFTGLAAGALAAGAFNTGAAASQADDRIIYNSATGALLFDADGLGGAAGVQFATLSPGLAMAASEFIVI